MLENMSKLKKLSFGCDTMICFRVRSQSLEEIDARHSLAYVTECICPSLKILHCVTFKSVRPITLHGWVLEGVNPITVKLFTPFTQEELQTEQDFFKVGDRPFMGMTVPNSCIVRLYFDMHL